MTVLGLHCCVKFFSSCGKWGLLSSCSEQTFHGSGFSYCGAWALGHAGFVRCGTWAQYPWLLNSRAQALDEMHGVSCSMACGIFLDQGSNPCLLHWQTNSLPLSHQETPEITFLYNFAYALPFHFPSTYLILNKAFLKIHYIKLS